jgi:hypothetical protein
MIDVRQRVVEAIKLLRPMGDQLKQVETSVATYIFIYEEVILHDFRALELIRSKEGRAKFQVVVNLLRKLKASIANLPRWQGEYEEMFPNISKGIASLDCWLSLPTREKQRHDAYDKQWAAYLAEELLIRYKQPVVLTPNGQWQKLASVLLYGTATKANEFAPACRHVRINKPEMDIRFGEFCDYALEERESMDQQGVWFWE